MADNFKIGRIPLRIVRDDITVIETDCFVFYARPNLKLGSGFGTAISVRGGPSIQAELDTKGHLKVTEVVTTAAGNLKARAIIHAVGPAFQEEHLEEKLYQTVLNVLREADRNGFKRLALPEMGVGFYGIPLTLSAQTTLRAISDYVQNNQTGLEELTISVLDTRDLAPFRSFFELTTAESRRH